jgi:hypothetical protein
MLTKKQKTQMLQLQNIQMWRMSAAIKGCAVIIPTVNTEKGNDDFARVGVTCT